MNTRDNLYAAIRKAADGKSSYEVFQREFYEYYHMRVSRSELTEAENEFFSVVSEKFDFTGEKPTNEDRGDGYVDFTEFVQWLKERLEQFLSSR